MLLLSQGSAFKKQILTVMQGNTFFNTKMLFYNSTAEGSALYMSYYNIVASTFPKYLEELRGMADGASIAFSKVMRPTQQLVCGEHA